MDQAVSICLYEAAKTSKPLDVAQVQYLQQEKKIIERMLLLLGSIEIYKIEVLKNIKW
jgi:hypothetical protein